MPDDVKLNAAIDAYADTSLGSEDDGELAAHRALNLDAYAGKNIEPAPEGRSQVTDFTIFETIQWMLPSLIRIFANGDNIVEFAPTGEEDEEAAEQESDYLNFMVTQKNNWFLLLLTWFQDALLTKNAYCMAFIEEKEITEKESYVGQSEEALSLLLEDDVEVVEGQSYPDPDDTEKLIEPSTGTEIPPEMAQEAMALAEQTGIPLQVQPPRTLYDVQIRRTKPTKKLQFKVLPPERVKVGDDTPDFTTENCNYFEYFEEVTISSLRAQGFEVDDDIASDTLVDSEEDESRNIYVETDGESNSPDPSMRIVVARTIWIRFDYDEDGIAELQKVIRVGHEILAREDASRIPVACIVPYINTHRHMGNCVGDMSFDIQRIKTVLLRGGLDSVFASQNPGHQVSDKVNMDDMLVSRPNRLVRLTDGALPSEGHIMPLITEFTLPQTLEGLRHMDTVNEARNGVNRMFQGIDDSNLNDHNRIGQLSTMAAQRVEQIARIFGNGVEYLFSIAHELIIKSGHQAESIKLRGEWVEIDPSQWSTGRDMSVVAPFAAGNTDNLVARLMNIASIQERAFAGGLPIATPDDAYNTAIELVKASGFPVPEKFFTQPKDIPQPEPKPTLEEVAQEIEREENQSQERIKLAELTQKEEQSQRDTALKKYTADLSAEVDLLIAQASHGEKLDLETLKARLASAPIELENESITRTGQAVSDMGQGVSDILQKLTVAVSTLQEDVNAEKEIVRDDQGRVSGTRRKANGQG